MSTQLAYPGRESNGDTLTTTNFDLLPGGWIGYVEVTSSQTSISSSAALTGLSVTVTVNTSRRVKVTCGGQYTNDTNAGRIKIYLTEGGATIRDVANDTVIASEQKMFQGSCIRTPSATSHAYAANGAKASGSGTFDFNASAADAPGPSFLLVEDVGPA
jgi:hypothetical protein